MEKTRNKVYQMLFVLSALFIANNTHGGTPITISFEQIEFNSGYILTLGDGTSNNTDLSEYFAFYLSSNRNSYVDLTISSNCSDPVTLIINANQSGSGLGNMCKVLYNYTISSGTPIELNFDGAVPSSIGKYDFNWNWTITAIPCNTSAYVANTVTNTTHHCCYVLYDEPQAPEASPKTDILDYACEWAYGSTTENQVCTNILSNGFNQHYTWDYQCHKLASDFVRLVSSLGITAYLHRWARKDPYYASEGQMIAQKTIVFDPVGPTHGNRDFYWSFHQWAEAASYQRDPSANKSVAGNWGAYEDYVYAEYEKVISQYPYSEWVNNQDGQSSGCEAPGNRDYYEYPGSDWILYTWMGPSR
jgi:hypothetical protein